MNLRPMTIVSALSCAAALAACGGFGGPKAQTDEAVPANAEVEAAAKDLQELYQRQNPAQASEETVAPAKPSSTVRARNTVSGAASPSASAAVASNPDDLQVTLPGGETKSPAPANKSGPNSGGFRPSPAGRVTNTRVGAADWSSDRAAQMARELSEMLAAQPATRSNFSKAVQLAALAEISPAGETALNDIRAKLSPSQVQALTTVQATIKSMVANADGDTRALADMLRGAAQQIEQSDSQLKVPTLALCTKVDGFARYTMLPSTALRAGRAQSVLVYTEVENFVGRDEGTDSSGNSRVRVEIGQKLELLMDHGAQSTVIDQVPEQIAREVANRQRRDFYLLQRYQFPDNLAPGRYTLKATVRDLMGGGGLKEVNMPITVVAGDVSGDAPKPVQRGQ